MIATKAYSICYPDAIRLARGAVVTVVKEDPTPEWAGWLWCRADDGQSEWISRDYLEVDGSRAVLARDYDAREVALVVGESVEVLREERGWGWVRKTDGSEGWVPMGSLSS